MDKFIELHTLRGEALLVNLSLVLYLFSCKKGTTLLFVDGLTQDVAESYKFFVENYGFPCKENP